MEFQVGETLEFEIYGTYLRGKFISEDKHLVKIEVTYDSNKVAQIGQVCDIHKSFIKK